jgi:hypothetical protein
VDLIRDGVNGRLVDVEDARGLAQALIDTLTHPSDIGSRGRQTVCEACSVERVVSLYERLFASIRLLPAGITRMDTAGNSGPEGIQDPSVTLPYRGGGNSRSSSARLSRR